MVTKENRALKAEINLRKLGEDYFADPHQPRIGEFMEQLFPVATDTGLVECTLADENHLRFSFGRTSDPVVIPVTRALSILRMLCARLGVLCQEKTGKEIFLYGDQTILDSPMACLTQGKWKVSFANTPDEHFFSIETL